MTQEIIPAASNADVDAPVVTDQIANLDTDLGTVVDQTADVDAALTHVDFTANNPPTDTIAAWSLATGYDLEQYRHDPYRFLTFAYLLRSRGMTFFAADVDIPFLVGWNANRATITKHVRDGVLKSTYVWKRTSAGGKFRQYKINVADLLDYVDMMSTPLDTAKTTDPVRDLFRVNAKLGVRDYLRAPNSLDGAIALLRAKRAHQTILQFAGPSIPPVGEYGSTINAKRIMRHAAQAAEAIVTADPLQRDGAMDITADGSIDPKRHYPVEIRPDGLVIIGTESWGQRYQAQEFTSHYDERGNWVTKNGEVLRDHYLTPGDFIMEYPHAFQREVLTTFYPGRSHLFYQILIYADDVDQIGDTLTVTAFNQQWTFKAAANERWRLGGWGAQITYRRLQDRKQVQAIIGE